MSNNEEERYNDIRVHRKAVLKNMRDLITQIEGHDCPELPFMQAVETIHQNSVKLIQATAVMNELWRFGNMTTPPSEIPTTNNYIYSVYEADEDGSVDTGGVWPEMNQLETEAPDVLTVFDQAEKEARDVAKTCGSDDYAPGMCLVIHVWDADDFLTTRKVTL